jgi:hypothetical protein
MYRTRPRETAVTWEARRLGIREGIHRDRLHNHARPEAKHRELYIREKEYNAEVSSHRAPVERAVAQLKTWRILFTDYRRPLETFPDSFKAAIGLHFFELSLHKPPGHVLWLAPRSADR